VSYSEQLDNAFYTKFNSSISANATTSPDGTTNADKLIANATNDTHGFYAAIISASAGTYTQSVFVKAGEYNFACLRLSTDYDTKRYAVILNLTTGAITATDSFGSPTNTSSKVDNLGNGWFRLSVTAQHTLGDIYPTFSVSSTAVPTFSNSLPQFTGNGTSGIFMWGAQLEASSYPTSYIPTTSASATRVADACSKTGISSLIGQTEGVMFVDFVYVYNDATYQSFMLDDNVTGSDFVYMYRSGTNTLNFYVKSVLIGTYTITNNTRYKIAFGYKSGNHTVYVNGASVAANGNSVAPSVLNSLRCSYTDGTEQLQCPVNQIILFPTRLTNAELASLTTI
jgi:hypothetical protein